ncbi:hypothetical protein [Nocardiopsis sp. NPDC057823]|uniref:hypothetical protein n=1 Tax=Nocardiopsis sp. NPDC057823 TaxID=3346256 RepID=UPI00366BFB05
MGGSVVVRMSRAPRAGSVVLAFFVLAPLMGCSNSVDTSASEAAEDAEPWHGPDWVHRAVRLAVLDRMILEQGEDGVLGSSGEDYEILVEHGILTEEQDGYRVEQDPGKWSPWEEVWSDVDSIDDSLAGILEANTIDWCGEEQNAFDFARSYKDRFSGEFDSQEEYRESIAEYVDCGDGRL